VIDEPHLLTTQQLAALLSSNLGCLGACQLGGLGEDISAR